MFKSLKLILNNEKGWAPLAAAAVTYMMNERQSWANERAADQNRKWQERQASDQMAWNEANQRDFAQNSIQWKVEDAKKAGIHPLYALGANTTSFSPVTVGGGGGGPFIPDDSGQNLGRAALATLDHFDRQDSLKQQQQMNKLQIENQSLQNDVLRSQLSRLNSAQVGPAPQSNTGLAGHLIDGQGNSAVVLKPSERTMSATGMPHQQAGNVSDVGFARTSTGLSPVPSQDVKERIEDQTIPEAMWAFRNNLIPSIKSVTGSSDHNTPSLYDHPLPRNHIWKFHPFYQEYRPYNVKSGKMTSLEELNTKPQGGW